MVLSSEKGEKNQNDVFPVTAPVRMRSLVSNTCRGRSACINREYAAPKVIYLYINLYFDSVFFQSQAKGIVLREAFRREGRDTVKSIYNGKS